MMRIYTIALFAALCFTACDNVPEDKPAPQTTDEIIDIGGMPYKIIPGLNSYDVASGLESKGFKVDKQNEGAYYIVNCSSADAGTDIQVTVAGKSIDRIATIDARVADKNKELWLIPYLCSVNYEGSNAAAASNWAANHLKHGGDTTINGVKMLITEGKKGIDLNIYKE